jgi:hypothetical protein
VSGMKWIALALALGACQHGDASEAKPTVAPPSQPRLTDAYRADIAALCDVIKQSGADQLPESDRMVISAQWLAQHITTKEGHDYLIAIQPLEGEQHAKALDDEAHRVGLPGCALAAMWRKPN